ncbi:MAG: hypothetical protein KGL39_12860 [Patescibacteria group bacterium]|nr:hypothetical protein [Patescibacteria group bacterium]
MKDDVQSHRQSSWVVEQCRLMPYLLVLRPWGQEGAHDILVPENDSDRKALRPVFFHLDHGWDDTFGYAFGEVHGMGEEAKRRLPDVRVGDFLNFTRCAYATATDREGQMWLFVNWQDCLAKFEAEPKDGEPSASSAENHVGHRVAGP